MICTAASRSSGTVTALNKHTKVTTRTYKCLDHLIDLRSTASQMSDAVVQSARSLGTAVFVPRQNTVIAAYVAGNLNESTDDTAKDLELQ